MSIRMMLKRCVHCHRTYPYDPSVGDFGFVCKHCQRAQIEPTPVFRKPINKPKFPKRLRIPF